MKQNNDGPAPLAAQLVGLHVEAEKNMAAVLARVAAIGYRGVEIVWLHGMPAAEFRSRLEDLNLELVGKHLSLETEGDLDAAVANLDEQEELGNKTMLCSFTQVQFESLDSTQRAIDRFNRFSEAAHDRGMRFGYHNHWWEFAQRVEGETVFDRLLNGFDPRAFIEPDIYWIQTGGADLVATLEGLDSRIRLLHVKDGPCTRKDPMTAAGSGLVDIPAAIAAAPHAEWHVVELDECAGDMFEAMEDSYRYLVENGLSHGRNEGMRA